MSNDILNMFGIDPVDFSKKVKKPVEKTGKPAKKKTTRAAIEVKYQLPIKLYLPYEELIFEGDGEWDVKKLGEEISTMRAEEKSLTYSFTSMKLESAGDIKTHPKDTPKLVESSNDAELPFPLTIAAGKEQLQVAEETSLSKIDGGIKTHLIATPQLVGLSNDAELSFPLTIAAGREQMQVTEDTTLSEIRKTWVTRYPEFEECKFHHCKQENRLIPFMQDNLAAGKVFPCPVTVGFLDKKTTYQESDFDSEINIAAVKGKFASLYPQFKDCFFHYNEGTNHLFPIVKATSLDTQKKTKLISVPVTVYAGNLDILVEPSDLGGKKTATLVELQKFIEKQFPQYTKERTAMEYDEKKHFVVAILKSAIKGIVIRSKIGWEFEEDDLIHQVKNPFGIWRRNKLSDSLQFQLLGKKIPAAIRTKILEFFMETIDIERAAQIFYDPKQDCYELYIPEQVADATSVTLLRNAKYERDKLLVMEVHSHNRFQAYFSGIDNRDEKGTMLYMVIGELDKEPQYALRAGMNGCYKALKLEDVFTSV